MQACAHNEETLSCCAGTTLQHIWQRLFHLEKSHESRTRTHTSFTSENPRPSRSNNLLCGDILKNSAIVSDCHTPTSLRPAANTRLCPNRDVPRNFFGVSFLLRNMHRPHRLVPLLATKYVRPQMCLAATSFSKQCGKQQSNRHYLHLVRYTKSVNQPWSNRFNSFK